MANKNDTLDAFDVAERQYIYEEYMAKVESDNSVVAKFRNKSYHDLLLSLQVDGMDMTAVLARQGVVQTQKPEAFYGIWHYTPDGIPRTVEVHWVPSFSIVRAYLDHNGDVRKAPPHSPVLLENQSRTDMLVNGWVDEPVTEKRKSPAEKARQYDGEYADIKRITFLPTQRMGRKKGIEGKRRKRNQWNVDAYVYDERVGMVLYQEHMQPIADALGISEFDLYGREWEGYGKEVSLTTILRYENIDGGRYVIDPLHTKGNA